jgi:hypothetical protein
MQNMNGLNIFGLVLLAIGGLSLLWSMRGIVRRRALLANPVRVEGRVIRLREESPSNTECGQSPKIFASVQYMTKDGQSLERELPASNEENKWQVGQSLRLIYQRGNPANVVDEELAWADLVKAVIGSLIVLGFGVLLCFFTVDMTPGPTKPEARAGK